MGSVLHLESFDADAATDQASSMPVRSYDDGYAEGFQAALAQCAVDQGQVKMELVQSVTEAAFGYHEAQAHLVKSVTSLLEAMVSVVLPEMLAPALHAHIRDMVGTALLSDLTAPVRLKVHPTQLDAVRAALADIETPYLKIVADPTVGAFGAWVTGPERETALDLERTLTAIQDHVAILLSSSTETQLTEAS